MDYRRFCELRGPRWDEFEKSLAAARNRPRQVGHEELERLAIEYRHLLHDLALTRARFPGTGAATRLTRLAVEGTHWLRRDRRRRRRGVRWFFGRAFPRAVRRQLPQLAVACSLFAVAGAFGIVLTIMQPSLGFYMLGPQTIAELEDGKLWTEALFTSVPRSVSSSRIATNNMSVALVAWAGGGLAGLGSLYVTLLNGFHLFAIVGVTIHYGMASELFTFVAAHGPLELTLILVAAAAGLGLARGMIRAEDRPRWQVAQEEARHSLILVLGLLPWFLLLGLVEAIISPSPAIPVAVKLTVGLGLLAGFLAVALRPVNDEDVSADRLAQGVADGR